MPYDRRRVSFFLCILCFAFILNAGCGNSGNLSTAASGVSSGSSTGEEPSDGAGNYGTATDGSVDTAFVIGLVLSACDDEDNDEVIALFEELASLKGASLEVYIPDVTKEEVDKALALETGTFQIMDVNPIEYQMLGVNEMVAAGAEVIAIKPNHPEALESVLGAAMAVGIKVCVWGTEVPDGSYDIYEEDVYDLAEEI